MPRSILHNQEEPNWTLDSSKSVTAARKLFLVGGHLVHLFTSKLLSHLLQTLRGLPLCQCLPLLFWRRAAHWLWPAAVILTLKLPTPGTEKITEAIIFLKEQSNLSSPPSSPLTLDHITVELRTSWAPNDPTPPLLMLRVSENVTHLHETAPKVLLLLPCLFSPLLLHSLVFSLHL